MLLPMPNIHPIRPCFEVFVDKIYQSVTLTQTEKQVVVGTV